MKILCPTCDGKGTIDDPKCIGRVMSYSGPNGETCPQVTCQSCYGEGWVEQASGLTPVDPYPRPKDDRRRHYWEARRTPSPENLQIGERSIS